jgi:phospholipid/cholesterol/gamma-HCH transport system ATP-binding protein
MADENAIILPPSGDNLLEVRDVTVRFGTNVVLDKLSMDLRRREILGFVGPSGSGKSVLLRTVLGLNPKASGTIRLFGQDMDSIGTRQRTEIDMRMGVLFQHGALFSSLTVVENIQVPMREYLNLPQALMDKLARLKLDLVGLPQSAGAKMPSELSGGMIKRAALARALALDPELVFLDEPTSGLDPIGAAEFDNLIQNLRDTLGLTVYMVTHDLDSLFMACDRIAVLGEKRVVLQGGLDVMLASEIPWVKQYFRGDRARHISEAHRPGTAKAGSRQARPGQARLG